MRRTFPTWAIVLVIVVLALSQPLFLLLAWYFKIGPATIKDANELGAIMGAIFTAGGLIVAIISVYTMASIESVTRGAVKPLIEGIPREVDSRIRRFLEAYGHFMTAKQLRRTGFSWDYLNAVEDQLQQSLALEPTISGVYSLGADVMYSAVAEMYRRDRFPEQYSTFPLPPVESFPSIATKASKWLHAALDNNDPDRPTLLRRLALLSGMTHANIGETVKYVDKARDAGASFISASDLLRLLASCKSEKDIRKLAAELELDLPLPEDRLTQLIYANEPKHDPARGIPFAGLDVHFQLIVLRRLNGFDARLPITPGIISILFGAQGQATAHWRSQQQTAFVVEYERIPSMERSDAPAPSPTLPIPALAHELVQRFYICDAFTGDIR